MTPDHFEATFIVTIEPSLAWRRLTEHPTTNDDVERHCWLPGFDSEATVVDEEPEHRLRLTKDDEPCAGTDILVTLEDAGSGTRITVVQSRFGDWMPPLYDSMAVGWRHLVADLQTYVATGVHARRHLRPWGDLGAQVVAVDGGLRITAVRPESHASRLDLRDGDLLVVLADAPVSTHDDLLTVLRVLEGRPGSVTAEWVRDGELLRGDVAPVAA